MGRAAGLTTTRWFVTGARCLEPALEVRSNPGRKRPDSQVPPVRRRHSHQPVRARSLFAQLCPRPGRGWPARDRLRTGTVSAICRAGDSAPLLKPESGVRPLYLGRHSRQRPVPHPRVGFLCALALILLAASSAQSQSISRGTLNGLVRDDRGAALAGARVVVTEVATGVTRKLFTGSKGEFRLRLLPPGGYDVFVEELGYQPRLIHNVSVYPARSVDLAISLTLVELPINQVATETFAAPVEGSRAGLGEWYSPFAVQRLPEERREITDLGRLSTISDAELTTSGLPGHLSRVVIDGLPGATALHPDLPPGRSAGAPFSLSAIAAAELLTNGADVEWSGSAGAYLSAYSHRGTRQPEVRAYGDWTGGALTTSDFFESPDAETNTVRAGAVLSGPIVRDTAHYVLGVDARRLETTLPRAWEIATDDASLQAVAQDSFGVDLSPYIEQRVAAADLITAFGRFDWQIAGSHALSTRADFAYLQLGGGLSRDPSLGREPIASLGSEVEGLDLSTGATLASQFGRRFSQELRFGVNFSERTYRGTSVLGTRIVDGGQAFGTDPAIPGEFERIAFDASQTLHLALGSHRLKAGLALSVEVYEQRYAHGGGLFTFAGVDEFARREGTFSLLGGAPPFAEFNSSQLGIFIQDLWAAAPGLDVLFGLRYEVENLDDQKVQLNAEWLERSGLRTTDFDDDVEKLSPRFAFRWDISQRGEWLVQGAAGVYHDRVSPGLFAELVTLSHPNEFRRGVGALGRWPGVPDRAAAPGLGPRLTLLAPEFEPPRSARASLGLSRLFAERTAVQVSGGYRHTSRLPRRADLNLALGPSGRDQHGRQILGTLVQQGSLLTVSPGSNRRFDGFDLVSAINADGTSDFWDVTFRIERHPAPFLDLLAAYTYSWTRDDWLSARGGGPEAQLTPLFTAVAGDEWREARSDFDAPHRAVLGAELKFPGTVGLSIAALYRFSSGLPFTPGFRDGVDVNGDGSGQNDPAFVDPTIPGMDELLADWDCLAEQVGAFAERNSCRAPGVHLLDARVALALFNYQGRPVELVVDALNLLDTDVGIRDRALYLIDRTATLQTGPDGTITLPLVVNPNFGEALVRRSSGRSLRLGVRAGL